MKTQKTVTIKATNREDYHNQLIRLFLKEKPGTSEEWNYYDYFVETGKNGKRIYLHRPAYKNKGMDFEVRVEDYQFRYGKYGNVISSGNRPSHSEIWNDVHDKVVGNPVDGIKLKALITKIYNCEEPKEEEIEACHFTEGLSLDLLLYTIKWLFIEQDIARPDLDFRVKILQPKLDARPFLLPHDEWVVDLLLKGQHHKEEIVQLLDYYLDFYDICSPFASLEEWA